MAFLTLYVALGILMVDALLEVAFVSSMVGFLHHRAGKAFLVNYASHFSPSGQFQLHGKPASLELNQGHTSNGAAGTAFVLIGLGGLLVLWQESRRVKAGISSIGSLYKFWATMTLLSTLLTMAALIYTNVVTHQTNNQYINLDVAAQNPEPIKYPLLSWTPENWFDAVLILPLASSSDRSTIKEHLHLMRGWRINLIFLFILNLLVCSLAIVRFFPQYKHIMGDGSTTYTTPSAKYSTETDATEIPQWQEQSVPQQAEYPSKKPISRRPVDAIYRADSEQPLTSRSADCQIPRKEISNAL